MRRLFSLARTRLGIFVHDLAMIPVAWFGAYWLRFNLESFPETFWRQALLLLPVVMLVQGGMFWYFGLYRGVWRFASIPDLLRILKASVLGVLIVAVAIFLLTRLEGVPRSVFALDGILLVLLLGGPRLAYRWTKDRHLFKGDGKRALIVGAGNSGEMLVRDMLRDTASPYRPAGFVDDNPRKIGTEIHGLPVAGACDEISEVVQRLGVDLIVIALPTATTKQLRHIIELCEATGLPFRTLPRLQDLVSGQASVKELRDVSIEDLLGREPVQLDWNSITRGLKGKAVMVTGGGGSIGAELCRQIALLKPSRLVVFERSEHNLFLIDLELRRDFPELKLVSELGDVCDTVAVERAFSSHRPDIVFHTAAYKHVPLLESQTRAAVVNNVFGTRNVARRAAQYGCATFVLISTDKAVNPTNVMGATKRVAEILCQHVQGSTKTRFVTVRFGNVLGSSGSVIPLFREQIARGGPVTVTHPAITRYFMTIPEACQLILQASVIAQGGEIFVLDMGEPIKISYLAEQLVRLSGKRVGEDIEIVYTGLRPGEKLHEELFHGEERFADTVHPKILLAHARPVDASIFQETITMLERTCDRHDESEIHDVMTRLVPELRAGNTGGAQTGNETQVYPWKGTTRGA